MTERKLLTTNEVAKAFSVHPKTVTRWANAGKLGCIKTPSGRRRFFSDEVELLLQQS